MTWFTSDLHFRHERAALEFRKERGYKTVQEHDQDIVTILNSKIRDNDIVYHLGDFYWGRDEVELRNLIHCLTGNWVFIEGNHDHTLRQYTQTFAKREIKTASKQEITLCHYPLLSWNKSHFGAWSLYGHHHSDVSDKFPPGKRMNVCWEVVGYKPVSFEEVKEYMDKQPDGWDRIYK